jgi:predicted RNA methylase
MGTGKQPISTAAPEPAGRVVQVELAPGRVLAELELGQVAVLELVIGLAVVPELETAPVVALELVVGPVVARELETEPAAALELVISPGVVPEPETAPVVVRELETAPEAEEPVPNQPRVQAAVVLRTKLVTAAHPRGLVPVQKRVEDLAGAAETTREPAAAEAAKAWEAVE